MTDNSIKEIAELLRATDEMAVQFVERVQARVNEPVSEAEVLAAMKQISAKTLTMDKVVAKVQQKRKTTNRRATQNRKAPSASPTEPAKTEIATAVEPSSGDSRRESGTILEQLSFVLAGNWDRAESEGFDPDRMSAEAFVSAIRQFTDRREGTRQRILQAARKLDEDDVVLTPALVADAVHELYES
jgi:hypothetical protein